MRTNRLVTILLVAVLLCSCGAIGRSLWGDDDASYPTLIDIAGEEAFAPEDGVCLPACEDKDCGDDGCGGQCGTCIICGEEKAELCSPDGICPEPFCCPNCDDKECGDDGCGGACGVCGPPAACADGHCVCEPDCAGKQCGPDNCGGECGQCLPDQECTFAGFCEWVGIPCDFGACGDWGDSDCGECPCPDCDPELTKCVDGYCEPGVGPGGMHCADIFDCMGECPQNDSGCQQQCITDAPIEAQKSYLDVVECLDEVGYYDCYYLPEDEQDQCYWETSDQCQDQIVQCWHGELTCLEMYLCTIKCDDWDYGCQNDCMEEGDVDAQYLWDDLIGCLSESGYWECADWDQQCFEETWEPCQGLFQECTHGDKTCLDVLDCIETCQPGDDYCWYECYFNGNVDAQEAYSEFLTCYYMVCGDGPNPGCFEDAIDGACAEDFAVCEEN